MSAATGVTDDDLGLTPICPSCDVRTGLYTTLAALLGGLLGFVITGVSILLTLGDGQRMNILRESAAFGQVFHIFTSTSRWLTGGTVLSLSGSWRS